MKILEMPQRSPEWFKIRRECFTSSEVGPFLWNEDKKALGARQNLIDEKIGSMADGEDCPPNYEDYWMKRGTLLEPMAVSSYERFVGLAADSVRHVGFVLHDSEAFGVSPDGLVMAKEKGLELKSPSGKIQVKRLREKILPPEYVCQCHLGLAATGWDEWDFYSYHPAMPPFHTVAVRSDFTERLHDAVMELAADFKKQRAEIASLWDEFHLQQLEKQQPHV